MNFKKLISDFPEAEYTDIKYELIGIATVVNEDGSVDKIQENIRDGHFYQYSDNEAEEDEEPEEEFEEVPTIRNESPKSSEAYSFSVDINKLLEQSLSAQKEQMQLFQSLNPRQESRENLFSERDRETLLKNIEKLERENEELKKELKESSKYSEEKREELRDKIQELNMKLVLSEKTDISTKNLKLELEKKQEEIEDLKDENRNLKYQIELEDIKKKFKAGKVDSEFDYSFKKTVSEKMPDILDAGISIARSFAFKGESKTLPNEEFEEIQKHANNLKIG